MWVLLQDRKTPMSRYFPFFAFFNSNRHQIMEGLEDPNNSNNNVALMPNDHLAIGDNAIYKSHDSGVKFCVTMDHTLRITPNGVQFSDKASCCGKKEATG